MLTILHGDDTVSLHKELVRLLQQAKSFGRPILRLSAKGLARAELETAIGTQELFTPAKTVVIEKLLSLPKGKNKDALVSFVSSHTSPETDLILIEEKLLTPAYIKQFPKATIRSFKLPAVLFTWLDALGVAPASTTVSLFHQVLQTQDVEFCFVMLVRQIRLLLQFVADGTYTGPPFGRTKIAAQAKHFSLKKLLALHERLLTIDIGQKTSRSVRTLTQEIDLLLLEI